MEKPIRKILSMLLALTMVLAMLPAGVMAAEGADAPASDATAPTEEVSEIFEEGTCGENLTWTLPLMAF